MIKHPMLSIYALFVCFSRTLVVNLLVVRLPQLGHNPPACCTRRFGARGTRVVRTACLLLCEALCGRSCSAGISVALCPPAPSAPLTALWVVHLRQHLAAARFWCASRACDLINFAVLHAQTDEWHALRDAAPTPRRPRHHRGTTQISERSEGFGGTFG